MRVPTKLEIANVVVAIIGIAMILCSSLFTVEQDSLYAKLLSIIENLGVGIFPTGVIGYALERMQNRSQEVEKKEKRFAILRLFNNSVHGYLNVVCNDAIYINHEYKYKKVFEIISAIESEEIQNKVSNEEKKALGLLIERLQDSFGTTNPLYIVTDVFEPIEISHFEMLLKEGSNLLKLKDEKKINDIRRSFLSYLRVTCLAIPECTCFNDMISDGDNIFIPNNDVMYKMMA